MQPKLPSAFEATVSERIINTVPDMPDHVFSKRFEKKMKQLIQQSKTASKSKITVKRMFICITAAVLAATIMALSVGAVRDFFKNFFMQIFDTHTTVQSNDIENMPTSIKDVYTIIVPDGFELVYEDEIFEWSPYVCYDYYKDDIYIFFAQYVKEQYDVDVNTENRLLEYISVNDNDGYIVDLGNNEYFISWDNGEYIFDITSNIGQKQLIKLAESVHKVE